MIYSTAVLALLTIGTPHRPDPVNTSVEAYLYSTMPSVREHRPEMALDGDEKSYFASAYGMEEGDDFMVLLSHPVSIDSVRVITGDLDGNDELTEGLVDASDDLSKFTKIADFDKNGSANASLHGKSVMALRIRLNRGKGLPRLVIREISISSDATISHVQIGPARGFYDISAAPDLADWASRAEKQMESFWPDTAAILYTDGFITPNAVNVVYETGPNVTGVAATGGGVMTVNSAYCRSHPNDTALTVHETAHVVQSIGADAPGWLIEGVADYIRWVKFEPQNFHPRIDPSKSTYHDAYQTSATFLGWVALHYDSAIVTKLSATARLGGYRNDLFQKYCGKDVDTLWNEFIAAYKADPTHIITPPVPAGMIPRNLPAVTPSTSVAVDLTSIFDIVGIVDDGTKVSSTSGFDGEGASYSSKLLSGDITAKDVKFHVAGAGVPDAVSAKGNVVPLPEGAHHSLWLLASAIEGAHHEEPIVITYTDGTTQSFVQNFSDWYLPSGFPGESRAVKTEYRELPSGDKDPRTFYVYSYGCTLDASKRVKSVTLPNDQNIRVFGISMAD